MQKLYRYEVQLHTDESATSTARIPVAGVTVSAYRQGAYMNGGSSGTTLTVHDLGSIVAANTVVKLNQVNDNATSAQVSSVPTSGTSITVDSSLTWNDGDRLINTTDQPTLYSDDQGGTSLGNSVTTDSSGYAMFYCRERIIDMEVVDANGDETLLKDVPGVSGTNEINVADFGAVGDGSTDDAAAFQAAIDYLEARSGGVLTVGEGTFVLGSALSVASGGISIRGAGRGISTLNANGTSGAGIAFTGTIFNGSIENLTITGAGNNASLIDIGTGVTGFQCFNVELNPQSTSVIGVDDSGIDSRYDQIDMSITSASHFFKFDGAVRPHLESLVVRYAGNGTSVVNVTSTSVNVRLDKLDIRPHGLSSSFGTPCVLIDGTTPQDVKITNSYLVGGTSASTSPGIKIDTGTHIDVSNVMIEDSNIGIDINGGSNITVNGGTCETINTDGIAVDGATNVKIVNHTCANVSQSTTDTDSYYSINSDPVLIDNCIISGSDGKYAVEMGSSCTTDVMIGKIGGNGTPATAWYNMAGTPSTSLTILPGQESTKTLSSTETSTSALGMKTIVLAQSGATSLATLSDPIHGQRIVLIATNGNTTIAETGNIVLDSGATTYAMTANDTLELIYEDVSLNKWVEVSRSVNA